MRRRARTAAIALAWVGLWGLAVGPLGLRHRAIASPLETARALARGLLDGSLLQDLAATAARAGGGLLLGLVAGTALGLFSGSAASRTRALEPAVDFARAIPPLLLLPLLMLAFGYGEVARVGTIAIASSLVVSLQVAAGVRRAHPERLRALRAMGASTFQRVRWLHAYEMLPSFFAGTRGALGTALVVAVVSEMVVGAPHGLGVRALSAQIAYDAPALWAVVLTVGAIGFALGRGLLALERRVVFWTT